jgi:FkbM family methyltransferase
MYFKFFLKNLLKKILNLLNYKLISLQSFKNLKDFSEKKINSCIDSRLTTIINLTKYQKKNTGKFLGNFLKMKSSNGQDLFVLSYFNFKKKGFFVEFGAADGVISSNTYLLEKYYKWKGILAEPCLSFQKDLKKNRLCNIDFGCVFSESNKYIKFKECNYNKALSTIDSFSDLDIHSKLRQDSLIYDVKTISINDLLKKYNCPKRFDYLSIDTEGSEFEILKTLNFKEFYPKIITVEHNFNKKNRKKIFNLLKKNNYKLTFKNISSIEDWYIGNN